MYQIEILCLRMNVIHDVYIVQYLSKVWKHYSVQLYMC